MKIRASILRFRESAKFVLTLFVAPLTIALVADSIIQIAKRANVPLWQWFIIAILVLVFVLLLLAGYTDKFNRLAVSLESKLRAWRFAKPSVLVLDGKLGEGHEIPPKPQITDFSPMDWARVLAEQAPGWTIELGPVEKLQAHQVVINPFGETYPEQDPYNYTTFSQICRYVENGGVFVNVAGIPFWYCHNPRDFSSIGQIVRAGRVQVEYGKDGKNTITQKPLFSSLFPQLGGGPDSRIVHCVQSEAERKHFEGIVDAGGDTKAMMFRAYEVGTQDMKPLLRAEDPQKWLIGSLKYGDGFFLLAGLDLRGERNSSFAKVNAAIKAWVRYESQGRP